MRIVALVARLLLGLVFFVFGLNGFLNFIHAPLPTGLAGQYLNALIQSHYIFVVAAVQVIGGALLLVNRYVPLALTILGPMLVNILSYHVFLNLTGLPLALVVILLWAILAWRHRQAFAGIFVQRSA
jgi:putative oxidoreductase